MIIGARGSAPRTVSIEIARGPRHQRRQPFVSFCNADAGRSTNFDFRRQSLSDAHPYIHGQTRLLTLQVRLSG